MEILLRELRKGPKTYQGEDPDALSDLDEPGLHVEGPVGYDLSAMLVTDQLIVRGRVWVDMMFQCVRCSAPFARRIEEPAVAVVLETPRKDASAPGSDDEAVDLTPELREAMILAFPSHPLCGEDCKGLCAQCGCNRNQASCACRPPSDARWEGLSGLKVS